MVETTYPVIIIMRCWINVGSYDWQTTLHGSRYDAAAHRSSTILPHRWWRSHWTQRNVRQQSQKMWKQDFTKRIESQMTEA